MAGLTLAEPATGAAVLPDIRIAELAAAPYRLPLRRLWRSARGTLSERAGWLVRVRDGGGLAGYGDCAPLPAAGTETLAAAGRALARLLAALDGLDGVSALGRLDGQADCPAVRNALETALLDLAARRLGVPLADLLGGGAAGRRVAVNAALGVLDAGLEGRVEAALAAGYRVLKLKLGALPAVRERDRVTALARVLPPGVALRLDANGAWQEGEAAVMLRAWRDLPVESLEEPLAAFDPPALARLQARVPWPLALDESVPALARSLDGSTGLPVRRLVLKPAVLGGPRTALALAALAVAGGGDCVVTSTLESSMGLAAGAHLAAALPRVAAGLAHGLATAGWLAADLTTPLPISGGALALPAGSGLGRVPDEEMVFESRLRAPLPAGHGLGG